MSIRIGSHSWIGEAKKDGNSKEGFLQLTSRYVQASGNYAHDQGGILFYMVKTADSLGQLNTWRTQLTQGGNSCIDCSTNRLAFYSTHKLEGSGTDFKIRSMVISLYHQPLDKSARNSAKKMAAKKAPIKNPTQKTSRSVR